MKKALIIGGTTGIGCGLSQVLLANNYEVIVTGIEKTIIETLNNTKQNNFSAVYLDCINESPSEVIETLVDKMGGLDLLVFSAGIGNLNKDLGYKVENSANKLNVIAFTEIVDWSYRFFAKQGFGHLVAVTSISALFGSRVAPAYHAAKAYQINYMEGLRQKAKRSKLPIYITDARPGFVDTPMTEGKSMFWTATKERAGKQIYKLIKNKRGVGYITKRWRILVVLMHLQPRFVRNRL